MQSNFKGSPLVLLALQVGNYSQRIAQAIGEGGAAVYITESGRTAIRFCRAHSPDVVVIDSSLIDMSGFELVDSIRTDGALSEQPAILLLANTRNLQYRMRGFISGVQRCILKTDDPNELLEAVAVFTNKMQIQRNHGPNMKQQSMNLHCVII